MIGDDRVLYEDNHIIIVNKLCGELTQGDKSGDRTLADEIKDYLKKKYSKPGNVYLGIPHRLDRPTSGCMVYAKTEKALIRLNALFRTSDVKKIYWAVTDASPSSPSGRLVHYIVRNPETNRSRAYPDERPGSQKAVLNYKLIGTSERYFLLEIELETGRHHQIRAQLAALGIHIKGDLKYGAARSNPDGGISLHSRRVIFEHPVSHRLIDVTAPVPSDPVWSFFH